MPYEPHPADTSEIVLGRDLERLVDEVARNTHEVWAQARVHEGWSYGPQRDDARKEHPGLVPYEALSPIEREYDRRTTREVIRRLLQLGVRIEREEPKSADRSANADPGEGADPGALAGWRGQLHEVKVLSPPQTRALWEQVCRREHPTGPATWSGTRDELYRLVRRLQRTGQPLLAQRVALTALRQTPDDLPLLQELALALSDAGALDLAEQVLEELRREGHNPVETGSRLGRISKDRWRREREPDLRRAHLEQALACYQAAYDVARQGSDPAARAAAYYPGVNVATVALWLGRSDEARATAEEVLALCRQRQAALPADAEEVYWVEATMGEAHLILGAWDGALARYARAAQHRPGDYANLATTRKQACALLRELRAPARVAERLEEVLRFPVVAVFACHKPDASDRAEPPVSAEQPVPAEQPVAAVRPLPHERPVVGEQPGRVHAALERLLARHDVAWGYAVAGAGSDLLVLDQLAQLLDARTPRGELHLVLPKRRGVSARRRAHRPDGDGDDAARLHALLDRSWRTLELTDEVAPERAVHREYADLVLTGLARLRAERLGARLVPVVVEDGGPERGHGGARFLLELWRSLGLSVEVVRPDPVAQPQSPLSPPSRPPAGETASAPPADAEGPAPKIQALLFADVVGFSKLTDLKIARFVEAFLGALAGEVAALDEPPVSRNTWGDALFLVFDRVEAAAACALRLRARLREQDWAAAGLPEELTLRFALHAGPCHRRTDPITQRTSFFGAHVNWAARIEPVTPPGEIYASEPFAAIAAARGVRDFRCDHVGPVSLAKGFGAFTLFHVRAAGGGSRSAAASAPAPASAPRSGAE